MAVRERWGKNYDDENEVGSKAKYKLCKRVNGYIFLL